PPRRQKEACLILGMRILILNSEYPPVGGGAGNASAHIAMQLAKMGHQISVVTSQFRGLPHEEQDGLIALHRVPSLRRRQDRSTPLEQMIFLLSATLRCMKLIPRFQPDAVLAFFGIPSGMVAWLIKKRYGIPYVVSLRGG